MGHCLVHLIQRVAVYREALPLVMHPIPAVLSEVVFNAYHLFVLSPAPVPAEGAALASAAPGVGVHLLKCQFHTGTFITYSEAQSAAGPFLFHRQNVASTVSSVPSSLSI